MDVCDSREMYLTTPPPADGEVVHIAHVSLCQLVTLLQRGDDVVGRAGQHYPTGSGGNGSLMQVVQWNLHTMIMVALKVPRGGHHTPILLCQPLHTLSHIIESQAR